MGITIEVKLNVDRWSGSGPLQHSAVIMGIVGGRIYYVWLSEGTFEKYLRKASETEHND